MANFFSTKVLLREERATLDQIKLGFFKGQFRSTRIVPHFSFVKIFEIEKDWRTTYKAY